ncbi:class I SAM-dependent methyltransferase, partial [bacterium]|nr:class I SAM-dependent methyltransferase [bacterium]
VRMDLLKGRLFAGLFVGGVASCLLCSAAFGIELSPLSVFSCEAVAAPAVTCAQAEGVPQVNGDRQRRDEIMADRVRAFEKELSAYFLREEKRRAKNSFPWRGHISGNQFLPRNVLKKNQAVWKKYLELCRGFREMQVPFVVRMRFYKLFFDVPSFNVTPEELALLPESAEWDGWPFAYITEAIVPSWYAANAGSLSDEAVHSEETARSLPERYRKYYNNNADKVTYSLNPNRGIRHLEGYNKDRAYKIGAGTIRVMRNYFGDGLVGKDMADLGAGCGFTLPLFRAFIGPKAKLYAAELDMYTLDVLTFLSRCADAEAFQCQPEDCCLPENSVDIINMTGVHLGLFVSPQSEEFVDEHIRPWLRTMAKALRPGGLLIVNDGNWDLIERGAEQLIESAGFEKVDYIEDDDHSTFTFGFKVRK